LTFKLTIPKPDNVAYCTREFSFKLTMTPTNLIATVK